MSVLLLAVKLETKKYAQAFGGCLPVGKEERNFSTFGGFNTVCLFSLMK
jgi:hypothetical protein